MALQAVEKPKFETRKSKFESRNWKIDARKSKLENRIEFRISLFDF